MSKNLDILKYIIPVFLGWRIILIIITFLGISYLPSYDATAQQFMRPSLELKYWDNWAHWDGGHYRAIAELGYSPFQTAFFPLYPLLIKSLLLLGIPSLWAALFISNLMAFIACFYFYKLILIDFNKSIAKKSLLAFLFFPTSFYLVSAYTESTFIALAIAAFYYARTRKWFIAFLLTGLATSTRLVGVAVIAGIAIEYFFKNPKLKFYISSLWATSLRRFLLLFLVVNLIFNFFQQFIIHSNKTLLAGVWVSIMPYLLQLFVASVSLVLIEFIIKNIDFHKFLHFKSFYFLISFIPFGLFILYQDKTFHNSLSFISNQEGWGRHFSYPWDIPLIYFNLISNDIFSIGEYHIRNIVEFLVLILNLCAIIVSLLFLRPSYTIYQIIVFLIPLFTGTLISTPRFAITIFPLFILFGLIKSDTVQKFRLLLSAMILALFSILYVNGYWIV